MERCLLIQKKSRIFLLLKYPDRYHIIDVNDKLDEQAENTVLAGDCSDADIARMGLKRVTILKSDLRGVAIGGCLAGDVIVLYTKGRKLKYVLSDDCAEEDIKAMFIGIERFQPPKNAGSKHRNADWRTEIQTESMGKKMGIIGVVLNLCGCVCFVCTSLFGRLSAMWSTVCLLITAVSLGFYFLYPQYFSIMGRKEYKRVGYTAKVKHLDFAILAPALALELRCLRDFHFLNWMQVLIAGGVFGIVLSIVIYLFSREVRENTGFAVVVLLFTLFVSSGFVGQINHLANPGVQNPQICTVIDTERENGVKRADRYYCVVELSSGAEMEIPISGSRYHALQPGDAVSIYIGKGAFGIEYAYLADME